MFTRDTIYTIHQNDWKNDPADQVVLVREGFAFWACLLTPLWFAAHRLWLALLAYIAITALVLQLNDWVGLSTVTVGIMLLGLHVWIGFNAYDIKRWSLARRGFTMRGVVVAASALMAEHRARESA